ncbi:Cell division control 4 [Hyphodiscus hymeniophilus]|uniref:Cell division control 4 n=1 Tax=Hyphodiscus hymeniophilus TaxID=353542 RepID=A0A9P6VJ51_9HELO|nr:Cell division control 4 [Hyphodiscus hymeniophilus]
MDPLARPHKRRAASALTTNAILPGSCTPAGSPSPSTSKSTMAGTETRRPRTGQTVSLGWEENEDSISQSTSRLHIDLAECVETKTVTTTTTTKRSYPPILLRHQPLGSLDAKEYPLARKVTPPEITHMSYEIDGQLVNFTEAGYPSRTEEVRQIHLTIPTADAYLQFANYFSQSLHITPSHAALDEASRLDQGRYATEPLYSDPGLEARHRERPKLKIPPSIRRRSTRGQIETQETSPTPTSEMIIKSGQKQDRKGKGKVRVVASQRNLGLGMRFPESTDFPVTPDTSELEIRASDRVGSVPRPCTDTYTPQSGPSQNSSFNDVPSPLLIEHHEPFASAVATPPIAESDLEPFDRVNEALTSAAIQRPSLNIVAAQTASLPSPGLSPTYNGEFDDGEEDDIGDGSDTQSGGSQDTVESDLQVARYPGPRQRRGGDIGAFASMLETFESMPNDMKTFMMFNFLKRCTRKTLHLIADTVNPVLKCDFLDQLPTELSLNILSFLDYRDLCRAAQVSKQWRSVVDSNETCWKELLDRDGFVLPKGELERAINQGWGWQDPYGPDGFEQDLSVQRGPSSSDGDGMPFATVEDSVRRVRPTTKRKRLSGNAGSERAKRRATGHEFADKAKGLLAKYPVEAEFHKSEGPLTAANAAALAVPDPQIGLQSLRKLHLFKSLYRRRYMLRRSWTSGKVQPHHFAFPAHPTHVITCLQFDDDKILTGSDDTLIHVYDTQTGMLRKKLEGHEGGVWALQYEGNVLVSGSTDRSVRVWDIEKGLCTQVFHGHTSTVRCLQILMPEHTGEYLHGKPVMKPVKPLIITGSRDSQLRVWRLPEQGSKRYIQTGPPANDADCPYFVRVLAGHTHSVRAIAAHQDTLVSGSYDNTVRVWKISTGETLHRLQGHSMKVYSVVLDHKRNRCISGSMDNFVKIWSLDSGACLFTLEGHTSLVGLLDLRDDRLVSAAADSTLRIWDPENGQCKSTLTAHTGAITCFQHDGQKVISGSDRTLKMWNVKTGECIKDLLTDLSGVWQVKFDERRCVAAVQRDNLTFVEVLDFGASRDGIPADKRGFRTLIGNEDENRIIDVEEEDV